MIHISNFKYCDPCLHIHTHQIILILNEFDTNLVYYELFRIFLLEFKKVFYIILMDLIEFRGFMVSDFSIVL